MRYQPVRRRREKKVHSEAVEPVAEALASAVQHVALKLKGRHRLHGSTLTVKRQERQPGAWVQGNVALAAAVVVPG